MPTGVCKPYGNVNVARHDHSLKPDIEGTRKGRSPASTVERNLTKGQERKAFERPVPRNPSAYSNGKLV